MWCRLADLTLVVDVVATVLTIPVAPPLPFQIFSMGPLNLDP